MARLMLIREVLIKDVAKSPTDRAVTRPPTECALIIIMKVHESCENWKLPQQRLFNDPNINDPTSSLFNVARTTAVATLLRNVYCFSVQHFFLPCFHCNRSNKLIDTFFNHFFSTCNNCLKSSHSIFFNSTITFVWNSHFQSLENNLDLTIRRWSRLI